MEYDKEFKAWKESAFDAFCKKVLRNEARDMYRKISRRLQHEVLLCDLPVSHADILTATFDEYFAFEEPFVEPFSECGAAIPVYDKVIAEALRSLEPENRAIVLMAYFLRLTDRQIGGKLGVPRSTIQYRRSKLLRDMRRVAERFFLEEER